MTDEEIEEIMSTHPFINDFHRESTERCLREIQEMKKTPVDYEKEYRFHYLMNKAWDIVERDPTIAKEDRQEKYHAVFAIEATKYDEKQKKG